MRKRLLFRSLTALLVVGSVAGCNLSFGDLDELENAPEAIDDEALNFLVVGDWGRGGWFRQDNVAEQMAEMAAEIEASFVISTGDNFYPDGVESVTDGAWEGTYEDVYSQESLQIPWYITLGNHDYLGQVQAQIDYTNVSDRWRLPARYHYAELPVDDQTRALFIFLDTVSLVMQREAREAFHETVEWHQTQQLMWLDSLLASSSADWKFVVGHHPIYSASAKHADSDELRSKLRPMLEQHGVDAYISGHVHSLQHLKPEGRLHYLVSGGGSLARKVGENEDALFAAGVSGFMAASLTPEHMRVIFADYKGTVGYSARLERQQEGGDEEVVVEEAIKRPDIGE